MKMQAFRMTRFSLPHDASSLLGNVTHAFFTRSGGVSDGIYASLNAGVGSGDDPAHVEENRRRLAAFFGCGTNRLATLKQVHSATCITVDETYEPASRPEADALATREPGIILGILTADCVPVLLYDPVARVIGAAHAGWKGAFGGVAGSTVEAMRTLGSQPADIAAAVGPSILQTNYEVDCAFREMFLAQNPVWERFFLPSPAHPATHFLYDNRAYVEQALRDAGINHIDHLANDTYAQADRYYSFRRATHHGEADYGRQLSAIML